MALLVTGVLAAAPAAPVADAATAVTTTVALTQWNWYWRAQSGDSCAPATAQAAPPLAPDPTVPTNDLAVAGPEGPECPGGPNGALKESYLAFDLSHIPPGSTIDSFRLTLPVDQGAPSSSSQAAPTTVTPPGGPPVIACRALDAWGGGPGAQLWAGKPSDACTTGSPKVVSTDGGKTYHVDITAIAQSWVAVGGLNDGVAITDDPANTSTSYQVVFGPATALQKLAATVTYVPAVAPAAAVAPPAPTSGSGPSAAGSTTGSAAPAGAATGPLPSLPTTPTQVRPLAAGVAPEVAGARAAATAQPLRSASSLPQSGFWVVAVLLALMLLMASVVLGDRPRAGTRPRVGGLSRALRQLRAESLLETP